MRVNPPSSAFETIPDEEHEEHRREDVRERERPGELPLQLVERDGEDRQQEEPVEDGLGEDAVRGDLGESA